MYEREPKEMPTLLRVVGFAVWIERVDSSGKIGIVMEDGAVRAVNEPAAESAA